MREVVRFLLGSRLIELRDLDPTQTVLDWLRLERRLTGTKEGCAEGDCGACTVLVGQLDGDRIRYQPINACIRFLATLDGCHVVTVEDLKRPDGGLNPVQEAMVACHGSQCGFCTPGFVMALQALYLAEPNPSAARINDALAGNLCRCTGYAPIIAAARQMYERAPAATDPLATRMAEIAIRLRALQDDKTLVTGRDGRRFIAPARLDEFAAICAAEPEATLVAGATDVGLWVTKAQRVLPTILYAGRVTGLRTIEEAPDRVSLGAMATYADAAPALSRLAPDLGELIRRIGAEQVRSMGTIGGNIANGSPIGDTPPALIALGAEIVLRHGGARRRLALEDYFLGYGRQDRAAGEFVERILIPRPGPRARFRAYKISKRFDQDISALCAAFLIELDGGIVTRARLGYGGMAEIPKRARHAEAALIGKPWDRTRVGAAMAALDQDFAPLTDWRASAGYRRKVAANLLLKCWIETTDPQAETRLVGAAGLAPV